MVRRDSGSWWGRVVMLGAALRRCFEHLRQWPEPLISDTRRSRRRPQAVRMRPPDRGASAPDAVDIGVTRRPRPDEAIPQPDAPDADEIEAAPILIPIASAWPAGQDTDPPEWEVARAVYQRRWQRGAGRTGGDWLDAEPGYRYGFRLAMEQTVPRRSWKQVEVQLGAGFAAWAQRQGYDPRWITWESVREHVREVWEDRTASRVMARPQVRAS